MKRFSKPMAGLALAFGLALSACNSAQPQTELASAVAVAAGPTCYSFDNVPILQYYHVGDTYVADKAVINFKQYLYNGGLYQSGVGYTNTWVIVNTPPPQFKTQSVVMEFVPNTPARKITFEFGETVQGVHTNFEVNGSGIQEYGSLADLDGQTIGGVDITVTATTVVKTTGSVELTANTSDISSVSFGGRTLYIDDFCHG